MAKNKDFSYFDDEEKQLLNSIENGEWQSSKETKAHITKATTAVKSILRKDKRMNIRISERDLKNLKIKALEEGIPYQTLVSMVLHKYITGKLKETA